MNTARSHEIIAATFSTDAASIAEARYQPTRTRVAVYAIGEQYFCCPPRNSAPQAGYKWRLHADQFFAQLHGRCLYVADMVAE